MRYGLIRVVAVLALTLPSTPAFAHVVLEGVSGFLGGVLHPILVPAHALGIVALGLFIGCQRGSIVSVLIFAVTLAGGLFAIGFAVAQTRANDLLLANTALLGILMASAWTPPRAVGGLLPAIAGAAIGLDSPPQTISIEEGNRMLLGTALSACVALALVAAAARAIRPGWPLLGVRILGSWIAASAILVLAAAMAR